MTILYNTYERLGYIKQGNVKSPQDLQKNYYREVVNSFGIPTQYFRHNSNYSKLLSSIYGEDTDIRYILSANVTVFMDIHNDSIMLKKFGLDSEGDGTCYVVIDDFYEQFRDLVGEITTSYSNFAISGNLSAFNGVISGYQNVNDYLSVMVSANVTAPSSGYLSGTYNNVVLRNPKKYHDLVYKSKSYNTQVILGNVSGIYEGTVDLSGNAFVSGNVAGTLSSYIATDNITGKHWGIAPQVGDFFRIEFSTDNMEEYEINKVFNRSLVSDGLNPLLTKYLWKMSVTRRDPSYEMVEVGTQQQESKTTNRVDESIEFERNSDKIFDYINTPVDTRDTAKSDDVYGGYTGPYA